MRDRINMNLPSPNTRYAIRRTRNRIKWKPEQRYGNDYSRINGDMEPDYNSSSLRPEPTNLRLHRYHSFHRHRSSVLTRRPPQLCPYRWHNLPKSVPGLRDLEGELVGGSRSLSVLPFDVGGRKSDRIGLEGEGCQFGVPWKGRPAKPMLSTRISLSINWERYTRLLTSRFNI